MISCSIIYILILWWESISFVMSLGEAFSWSRMCPLLRMQSSFLIAKTVNPLYLWYVWTGRKKMTVSFLINISERIPRSRCKQYNFWQKYPSKKQSTHLRCPSLRLIILVRWSAFGHEVLRPGCCYGKGNRSMLEIHQGSSAHRYGS